MTYENLEPFGDDRLERLVACIAMMMRNYGRKEQDMLPLERFMQCVPTEEPKTLSTEDRMAAEQAAARAAAEADRARRGG